MTKYKIEISIVIVNYKVKNEILKCINSIYSSNPNVTFEIIVVDNDSKNNLKKALITKYPNVKYVKSPYNLGFGAGINYGEKIARGEFLFFLNPDTIVEQGAIEELYKFIKYKKKVGIVSPLLLKEDRTPYSLQGTKTLTPKRAIFSLTILGNIFKNNKIANEYWLKDWNKNQNKEVDIVPGTAFMIKKTLFEKIGMFDERFFLYFEEFDLCQRIKKLRYKNYIITSAKVMHKWGLSTKQIKDKNNIFKKSRLYYFKKNYGLISSIFVEIISRLSINFIILLFLSLFFILIASYNIDKSMIFIGDQAWFYISAKDFLINNNFPLVGITSSHTWLHQGAFWTYLLTPFLYLFNFNPISGAYLSITISLITIYAIYFCTKRIFNKNIAIISATFYATSPLIINFSRMPYHTSPIPLFTILYIHSIFNWINGEKKYFPLIFLYLGILYNLELSTTALWSIFIAFFIYGYLKKTIWYKKIINRNTIIYSSVLLLIPMMPIIYYDFHNGFPQTVKFVIWMGYKLVGFIIPFREDLAAKNINIISQLNYFFNYFKNLIFPTSSLIAGLIFLFSFLHFIYLFKSCIKNKSTILISAWVLFSFTGIILSKTLSDAYMPIVFPVFVILTAIFYGKIINASKVLGIILILLTVVLNTYSVFNSKRFLSNDLERKVNASKKIINNSENKRFSIIGKGEGSEFRSFTMPYEYLIWWLNKADTDENQKLKYYIEERGDKIIIHK